LTKEEKIKQRRLFYRKHLKYLDDETLDAVIDFLVKRETIPSLIQKLQERLKSGK